MWRGGEIRIAARFGIHKVNFCSTSRFLFHVFISILIVICSAVLIRFAGEKTKTRWFCCISAPYLLIVVMIMMMSVIMVVMMMVLFYVPPSPTQQHQEEDVSHHAHSIRKDPPLLQRSCEYLSVAMETEPSGLHPNPHHTRVFSFVKTSEKTDKYTKHAALVHYYGS